MTCRVRYRCQRIPEPCRRVRISASPKSNWTFQDGTWIVRLDCIGTAWQPTTRTASDRILLTRVSDYAVIRRRGAALATRTRPPVRCDSSRSTARTGGRQRMLVTTGAALARAGFHHAIVCAGTSTSVSPPAPAKLARRRSYGIRGARAKLALRPRRGGLMDWLPADIELEASRISTSTIPAQVGNRFLY